MGKTISTFSCRFLISFITSFSPKHFMQALRNSTFAWAPSAGTTELCTKMCNAQMNVPHRGRHKVSARPRICPMLRLRSAFACCSTTPLTDAFKKKDGSAITFNGSVAAHPAFLQRIQAAFDDILGIFVPELLTYNYAFREAPQCIKMQMHPYVIGCATGSDKPWAELARTLQPACANGNAGWHDNSFDQHIACLDSRFDDKNVHKQGEEHLLADVIKVKCSDETRSVPFDARIEKFFSCSLPSPAITPKSRASLPLPRTQNNKHMTTSSNKCPMPRFMAEHISVLTMPDDVELAIEQIRPMLRQQHDFAKSKDMPLTDKEHAGPWVQCARNVQTVQHSAVRQAQ